MELTIQDNIAAFNTAFAEYVGFSSKQPQEALERKVKNIGIRLWRGFTAHEFGGVPKKKGVALGELRARTDEKRGTRVRPALLEEYAEVRDTLRAEAKDMKKNLAAYNGPDKKWKGMASALYENSLKRIGAWHEIVGEEIKLRQSGIGELGAAFLWYRKRGKGDSRTIVLNRTGKPLGEVTVEEGVATIIGEAAGMTTVDSRYGIVAQAIADETDDTMDYIKQKQDELNEQLGSATTQ